MTEQEKLNCRHVNMKLPNFDEGVNECKSWHEVRMRYPRYQGECPDCDKFLTVYANAEHRKAGNW